VQRAQERKSCQVPRAQERKSGRLPIQRLRECTPIVASQKLRSSDPVTENPTGSATSPPDFERSLSELEAIVDKLEAGDLSLDESLKQFERGVQLTRACQTALKQAEHKVEILMRKSGTNEFESAPFESGDDQDD
jgi:exodeoxyribonuclease VII small subunit